MPLDLGITVALLAFLVGTPVLIFFTSNLFERYEKKIIQVKNALIGSLEQPLQDLRGLPAIANQPTIQTELTGENALTGSPEVVNQVTEQIQYRNHREFMAFVEGNLLDMFNDYHDMKVIQKELDSKINHLLFYIILFAIPGILFQFDGIFIIISIGIFYILSLLIMFPIMKLFRDFIDIKKAYEKYVIEGNVFGDYD